MTGTPRRIARLAVAVVFVVPTIVAGFNATSFAAPTKAEVEAAQAEANRIGHELEVAIEQYNDARVRLQGVQDRLADALDDKQASQALAAEAMAQLEQRAVEAYTGAGSQMDVLLGASDLSEFSDRLEFMGALAQNDADLASAAENAQQQARVGGRTLCRDDRGEDRRARADAGQAGRDRGDARATAGPRDQLDREYREYIERQEEQAAAAAAAEQEAASDTGTVDPGSTGPPPPPPNGSAASAAIAAADSKLGAEYVWGTAGPDTFDCSGLTSWAYAQAGVYLPHSSAAQASSGAVVCSSGPCSLSGAQAGDLLFFYSPISHVALYVGGGTMVHARHPGPGGQVQYGSVAGYGTPVVRIVRPT